MNEYTDGNLFPKGKQVLINKCKEDEHSSDRLKREQKNSTRNFASSTEIWLPSYNFSEIMYELGSRKMLDEQWGDSGSEVNVDLDCGCTELSFIV